MDHLNLPEEERDYEKIRDYLDGGLQHLEDQILPALLAKSKDTTVVILAAEGSNRKFAAWSQTDWDALRDFYNLKAAKIVKNSENPNLYFMDTNINSGRGPNGEDLLPDGTHKMVKGA